VIDTSDCLSNSEDGGSMFLKNVDLFTRNFLNV